MMIVSSGVLETLLTGFPFSFFYAGGFVKLGCGVIVATWRRLLLAVPGCKEESYQER